MRRRAGWYDVAAEVVAWEDAHGCHIHSGLDLFRDDDGVLVESEEFFAWSSLVDRWVMVNRA